MDVFVMSGLRRRGCPVISFGGAPSISRARGNFLRGCCRGADLTAAARSVNRLVIKKHAIILQRRSRKVNNPSDVRERMVIRRP